MDIDYSQSISFSASPSHSFAAAQVLPEIAFPLKRDDDDIFLQNMLATDLLQHSSNQQLLQEIHKSQRAKNEGMQARSRRECTAQQYGFKTRSENEEVDDGYEWRKYGRKFLKSSPHPRNYYRCRKANCSVKKRVERDPKDDGLIMVTYEGFHNHECPSVISCCVADI